MRRTSTIIHPQLLRILAECGHTDSIVIADAGLPVPPGVERVDLAYKAGSPAFLDILDSVLAEFIVERAIISEELKVVSPAMFAAVSEKLTEIGIVIESVPHSEFKNHTRAAHAIVRTGEYTPFSNVVLYSGVPF